MNLDIPRIRLSWWQKEIIALEDAHILPGRYWLTWYDPLILLPLIGATIAAIYYLPETDIGKYPFGFVILYFMFMVARHITWLENHAKDILVQWGKEKGYAVGNPSIPTEEFLSVIGWELKKYHYAIQKSFTAKTVVNIFGADFTKDPPGWGRKKERNKLIRTLTFAHIKSLQCSPFPKVVVVSKIKSKKIFLTKDLKFFPNISGVNEFDRRFRVFTSNPQGALKFLNPLVILVLLHLTLPHELLVTEDNVLISSNRHFTRRRVLDELDAIATAIIDAHGGTLENASWEQALDYFQANPYKI